MESDSNNKEIISKEDFSNRLHPRLIPENIIKKFLIEALEINDTYGDMNDEELASFTHGLFAGNVIRIALDDKVSDEDKKTELSSKFGLDDSLINLILNEAKRPNSWMRNIGNSKKTEANTTDELHNPSTRQKHSHRFVGNSKRGRGKWKK